MSQILGLHHITAIAGDAQRNYDFYTKILGLRLVKKTVNFDDPETYHFYFGDKVGSSGSILTFFPWKNVIPGRNGTGMATEIGYSVPQGSLQFWQDRLRRNGFSCEDRELFGEKQIAFHDPDGLWLTLIETENQDGRKGFETADIKENVALKGFHTVTLTLNNIQETADILVNIFGYRLMAQENNVFRYKTDAVENAAIVDLVELPQVAKGNYCRWNKSSRGVSRERRSCVDGIPTENP